MSNTEANEIPVPVDAVINHLAQRIAALERDNAVLQATVEVLKDQLVEAGERA